MNFAYSEKQLRIGGCFKANLLSFWDANDDFGFEKQIQIPLQFINVQT